MDRLSQNARVLEYLAENPGATARDIFDSCRVNSPRKRISELRATHRIDDVWDESVDELGIRTRYKRYFLMGVVLQ